MHTTTINLILERTIVQDCLYTHQFLLIKTKLSHPNVTLIDIAISTTIHQHVTDGRLTIALHHVLCLALLSVVMLGIVILLVRV